MAKKENRTGDTASHVGFAGEHPRLEATSELLRELVSHLRQNRTQLREEWVRRITEARLLTAMSQEEIFAEATSVYDSYVEALETGTLWKRTKSLESFCSCATCWPVRSSQSIKPTLKS